MYYSSTMFVLRAACSLENFVTVSKHTQAIEAPSSKQQDCCAYIALVGVRKHRDNRYCRSCSAVHLYTHTIHWSYRLVCIHIVVSMYASCRESVRVLLESKTQRAICVLEVCTARVYNVYVLCLYVIVLVL
jgi:hypothetical protein